VALALLGSWVARRWWLPGDPPFELRLPVVAALAVAVLAATLACLLAVGRVAREPVPSLLRQVPPRRTGWALGVADALVIAGCGAVVLVFATGGLEGPVALAAPGLLAVVVGLVLAHLTMPSAAVLGRWLLRRGRVTGAVSVLDAARSPATRRVVAIATIASALAVFSADALLVGERNRDLAAQQEAGAAMVSTVDGVDLPAVREALAEVDPDGRRVTPVVQVSPAAEGAAGTLAVDPDSFRRIALFPGQQVSSADWDRLAPPRVAPVTVTAASLTVQVTDSTLTSELLGGSSYPVTVGVDLVNPEGQTLRSELGQVTAAGSARLEATISCLRGCTLTGIWLRSLPQAAFSGSATLRLSAAGAPVPLGSADQWTAYDDPDGGSLAVSDPGRPDALTLAASGAGAEELEVTQGWLPATLPTLVAGPLPPGSAGGRFLLTGLDGESRAATRAADLTRVPASPRNTFVVSLESASRGTTPLPTDRLTLWYAAADPALLRQVTSALTARGVALVGTTTLSDVRRSYDQSAAAWSLALAALVGSAAVLVALLVLLVGAASSWRFRSRDLAALRMSGVGRRTARRVAVAAQLPAVLLGAVAGTACGVAGAVLAMPLVPLFATAPEVSTLDLGTAWWGVLLAGVVAAVVLGCGSALIGRTLAARASVRRLREVGW
jgi:putative ABC transport system permease protein